MPHHDHDNAAERLQSAIDALLAAADAAIAAANCRRAINDIMEDHGVRQDLIAAEIARQETHPSDYAPSPDQVGAIVAKVRQQVDQAVTQAAKSRYPNRPPQKPPPIANPSEIWYPITECRPAPGDAPPSAIRIDEDVMPNASAGGRKRAPTWKRVQCNAAQWLIRQGLLEASQMPIRIGGEKRPAVSADQAAMKSPARIADDMYLETNYGARHTVERAIALLNQFGVNAAERCSVLGPPSLRQTDRPPPLPPPAGRSAALRRQPDRGAADPTP